jgi:hypothetical protein
MPCRVHQPRKGQAHYVFLSAAVSPPKKDAETSQCVFCPPFVSDHRPLPTNSNKYSFCHPQTLPFRLRLHLGMDRPCRVERRKHPPQSRAGRRGHARVVRAHLAHAHAPRGPPPAGSPAPTDAAHAHGVPHARCRAHRGAAGGVPPGNGGGEYARRTACCQWEVGFVLGCIHILG